MKANESQDGFVSIKPRGRQNLISQKNEFKSKFKTDSKKTYSNR